MDTRSIFGIVLCIVLFFGYNQYLQKKYPDHFNPLKQTESQTENDDLAEGEAPPVQEGQQKPSRRNNQTENQKDSKGAAVQASSPKFEPIAAEKRTLETEAVQIRLADDHLGFESFLLKNYKKDLEEKTPFELFPKGMKMHFYRMVDGQQEALPLDGLEWMENTDGQDQIHFRIRAGSWSQELMIRKTDHENAFAMDWIGEKPDGTFVEFSFPEPENLQESSIVSFFPVAQNTQSKIVWEAGNEYDSTLFSEICSNGSEAIVDRTDFLQFAGMDLHYFLFFVSPASQIKNVQKRAFKASPQVVDGECRAQFQLALDGVKDQTLTWRFYGGPKKEASLEKFDPLFVDMVDYGWFSIIARPLHTFLNFFYSILHNFGLAIIVLTIIIKVIFYPLTKAAAVSSKKMQKLAPQMKTIREKHKDDRAKQQQELMQFMAKHKINPAKGCLPILPQIPVFIAFFNILNTSIELRHAPFIGWIQDLSVKDPYLVMPIALGGLMVLQQKLMPNPSMDKTQEKIMMMVPIIFTFMMLSLPAGLVLYMVTNSVVSILQQAYINKTLKV